MRRSVISLSVGICLISASAAYAGDAGSALGISSSGKADAPSAMPSPLPSSSPTYSGYYTTKPAPDGLVPAPAPSPKYYNPHIPHNDPNNPIAAIGDRG